MKKFIALCAALALLLLAGCTMPTGYTAPPDTTGTPSTTAAPSIGSVPARIVSLSPRITEVLADLGVTDHLVGADTNSISRLNLTGVTGLDMINFSAEQIIALNPDLVLADGINAMSGDDLTSVDAAGIKVVRTSDYNTLADIENDILVIGQAVNVSAQGLVDTMKQQLAELTITTDTPKTVYFDIGDSYTFGSQSYINELLALAGAKNIFADQNVSYFQSSGEDVIAANPDVIFTSCDYIPDPVAEIKSRPGFDALSAVQNNRVYLLDVNLISTPNHHLVDALRQIEQYLNQ
ncbi:MAG: helical backbone metal receptor [Oscillospiraceae bacterium]|nr:helical backbone metal receptor [Oscillospiraceae bacterium]